MLWCNKLGLAKIKDQRKDRPRGLGKRQAQPGDWGRLSGCFSQIREIREKTDYRGEKGKWEGWVACSTCLQWKQVYATLPYNLSHHLHPPPPPPPHTHNPSTIFLLSHFFLAASLNYNDSFYHTLLIGKTVSLKFNRLCFNSVLWYFTFFSYLLDFLLVKGLDIGLHFQLLAQCTDYYCSVDVLSLLRSRLSFFVYL